MAWPWHERFAWLPVRLDDGRRVWLRDVQAKTTLAADGRWVWTYRLPQK